MEHTRSFLRRISAFLIDVVLAHLVVVFIFGWWALDADSTVRFGGSLVHLQRCHEVARTTPFLAAWDKVQDCNTVSDFVFPNREVVLQKIDNTGAITYIQEARISLNRAGKGIVAMQLDLLMLVVLFVGASLFEASSIRATPGKRMLWLEVASLADGQATIRQTLLRNFLKLIAGLYITGQFYFLYFYSRTDLQKWLEQGGQLQDPPAQLTLAFTLGQYAFAAVNIVILISVFFPFKNMGRGLYDRAAGTQVELF